MRKEVAMAYLKGHLSFLPEELGKTTKALWKGKLVFVLLRF
jgi:hypothetical protein